MVTDLDPDTTVFVISAGSTARVVHTERCGAVVHAAEAKVREVTRRQHPNLPLCKRCTEELDRTEVEQNHVAKEIRGLWADD